MTPRNPRLELLEFSFKLSRVTQYSGEDCECCVTVPKRAYKKAIVVRGLSRLFYPSKIKSIACEVLIFFYFNKINLFTDVLIYVFD